MTVITEETLALILDTEEGAVVAIAVAVVVDETGTGSCCWKLNQDIRWFVIADFWISRLRSCSKTFSAALARRARCVADVVTGVGIEMGVSIAP